MEGMALEVGWLGELDQGRRLGVVGEAAGVRRVDAEALDIKFHACPLKEAWLAAGYAPERIATLCRIAGVVDNGTFEAAGLAFSAETWRPGDEGCCFLHIRPGRAAAG